MTDSDSEKKKLRDGIDKFLTFLREVADTFNMDPMCRPAGYVKSNDNYLTMRWKELMAPKDDLMSLIGGARRSKYGKAEFDFYKVYWDGNKNDPTIQIPRYLSDLVATRKGWSADETPIEESNRSCKQRSEKTSYSPRRAAARQRARPRSVVGVCGVFMVCLRCVGGVC
jgi:hypothetical protein